MPMSKKRFRNRPDRSPLPIHQPPPISVTRPPAPDPAALAQIPESFQALTDYFAQFDKVNLFTMRRETLLRIEHCTNIPIISYVTKTHNIAPGQVAHIDDSDLAGFGDLVNAVPGDRVDVFIISNGGSAEVTERMVRLLRTRFKHLRFIVPANAYSAATLMCFSGDEILMGELGTLGPIDPQINGTPARAILRAFEAIEKKLAEEGPRALTAYVPLINKYDLHTLEICKTSLELSVELARAWLSEYMLKCNLDSPDVERIVQFFSSYDIHKSHGRGIDREKARSLGLKITNLEADPRLNSLIRSLYNQYEIWFDKTPFFKMFEDSRGTNWGRQGGQVLVQLPNAPPPTPQPGPPRPTTQGG